MDIIKKHWKMILKSIQKKHKQNHDENFISNDSNSCVILDDDDETNSKPVMNNTEQNENSLDDDCYCVDITDS